MVTHVNKRLRFRVTSVIRTGGNEKWHLSSVLEDGLELIWVERTACTKCQKYERMPSVFGEMQVVLYMSALSVEWVLMSVFLHVDVDYLGDETFWGPCLGYVWNYSKNFRTSKLVCQECHAYAPESKVPINLLDLGILEPPDGFLWH